MFDPVKPSEFTSHHRKLSYTFEFNYPLSKQLGTVSSVVPETIVATHS